MLTRTAAVFSEAEEDSSCI